MLVPIEGVSDTPRTDAIDIKFMRPGTKAFHEMADFARQLERENKGLQEALRYARVAVESAYNCVMKGRYDEAMLYLGGEGARITKALDKAEGK